MYQILEMLLWPELQMAAHHPVDWTGIFDRVKESVFFVLMEPKEDNFDDLQQVADRVATVMPMPERRARVQDGYSSTGSVLISGPSTLYIVTTAHSLDHLFKASDPLEKSTLDMFEVTVLCHHFEQEYQQHGLPGEREYARGYILAADCPNDILIVGVPRENLKSMVGDGTCARNHDSLVISEGVPRESKECMLVSWPSHMHDKVSRGWTSSFRTADTISDPNPSEYSMSLLEVHMTTECGSSGTPLVDEKGEVIGMLHGGFKGAHSYFVDVRHLRAWVLPARVSSGSGGGTSRRPVVAFGH
uniref:Uncharacterized protein n=1 Tax=Avena sativa TaxID=4498 RepID=A0ACD5WZN1_AVESA